MLSERRSGALATVLAEGSRALFDAEGTLIEGSLPPAAVEEVAARVPDLVRTESSRIVEIDGVEVFVEVLVPPPRLLLFGAGPIGEAVCAAAALAGFSVEVCDPRPAFARPDRFPAAASVVAAWPDDALERMAVDPGTYVVSVLHEARFEDQLLPPVLATDARYVGALGSRRTHEARIARLREKGFDDLQTARIHAPVGLDIGATTPEEIAIAIVAEMVAVRRGAQP